MSDLSKNPQGITLVLGGTGKTGRRVVERLKVRGVATRIGSRAAEPPFDWEDPSTWAPVIEDVAAVYIAFHPDLAVPGAPATIRSFVEQAVRKGVSRLVLLSGRGEEEAQRCERIVQESGIVRQRVASCWLLWRYTGGKSPVRLPCFAEACCTSSAPSW